MIFNLLKSKISVELYKFIVVGAWSTIINYGIFYIFLEFLDVNYLVSSAIGFISGTFFGYSFNRRWTFEVKTKRKKEEILKYFAVYVTSLILSLLFLRLAVVIGLDPKVANVLAIGITTCTNFIGVKLVVFK